MEFRDEEESVPEREKLRKKLGVAVRSVQWSYAIFWALSTAQQGVLEWGEGYYNGDIKTSKTVQSKETDAQNMGLQRSEQLRKLYQSLLQGESEVGAKRPSGTLSPEDLSNLEWYYLVCMSFVFKFGQSLPGKALATGQHIWLCDAQSADSKVFHRSLLAKSASVQTVICFPYMGGVIELGITDLVPEDLNILQHIKTTLLEVVKPICSEKYSYASHDADYDDYYTSKNVTENGQEIDTTPFSRLSPSAEQMKFDNDKHNDLHHHASEDFTIESPDDSSNDCCHHAEESLMLDSTKSPRNLTDDDISRSIQDFTTLHGSLNQNFGRQEKPKLSTSGANIGALHSEIFQDWRNSMIMNDTHYQRTFAAILENTNHFVTDQNISVCGRRSSFLQWKKDFIVQGSVAQASQKTLKTILIKIPLIHAYNIPRSLKNAGNRVYSLKPQACHLYMLHSTLKEMTDIGMLCTLEEKTDTKQYLVLKSMLPSITKVLTHPLCLPSNRLMIRIKLREGEEERDREEDNIIFSYLHLIPTLMLFQTDKTSILMDIIEYLKQFEARVDELETCRAFEGNSTLRDFDLLEHTSNNYGLVDHQKKPSRNKRKVSEIYETNTDLSKATQTDIQALDVKVSTVEHEVLIKMRCPWREHLLLDIMEAANKLNLDHAVQSSTLNGILSLFLRSKIRAAFASEGMIKQALRRSIGTYEEVN